jgi:hypothetical protein
MGLIPRKEPSGTHWDRRLGRPQSRPRPCAEEKNAFPLAGIEPRFICFPSISLVVITADNLTIHGGMDWGKLRKTSVRIAGLRASVWTRTPWIQGETATQCTETFHLTPYSRASRHGPTVPQLKKFTEFYGTRWFIAILTIAPMALILSQMNPVHAPSFYSSEVHLNKYYTPIYV